MCAGRWIISVSAGLVCSSRQKVITTTAAAAAQAEASRHNMADTRSLPLWQSWTETLNSMHDFRAAKTSNMILLSSSTAYCTVVQKVLFLASWQTRTIRVWFSFPILRGSSSSSFAARSLFSWCHLAREGAKPGLGGKHFGSAAEQQPSRS